MKIAIVDTYYPSVIGSLPVDLTSGYEAELRKILHFSFGTADFYSAALRSHGWTAIDIIANHRDLQSLWDAVGPLDPDTVALQQIATFKPDVVFLQDLSLFSADTLLDLGSRYLLAGHCSCPMPREDKVRRFHTLFTSFPHYIDRFRALGVDAYYVPLAFDPMVLTRAETSHHRIHDCVFVGGVGAPSHWLHGMQTLELAAREIPSFKWWGYGIETLPASSPLHACYQGPAFGLDMYRILMQSKIVLNRHGEVAEGYSNNMRMFEATGCGALLVTEHGINLDNLFAPNEVASYGSSVHAMIRVQYYLTHSAEREEIAAAGQRRTLRDHTYHKRMKTISDILESSL